MDCKIYNDLTSGKFPFDQRKMVRPKAGRNLNGPGLNNSMSAFKDCKTIGTITHSKMECPVEVGFHLMCLNPKSSSEATPKGLEILHRSDQSVPARRAVRPTPRNPSCIISSQA